MQAFEVLDCAAWFGKALVQAENVHNFVCQIYDQSSQGVKAMQQWKLWPLHSGLE
jgi:hypothetical protein